MGRKNYAYINPTMLVWARSETPFRTVESVEERFPSITAKSLESWERGEDYPSVTEAKKLASIYKLPFAAFYLTEAPSKKIKRYTDRRTLRGCYTEDINQNLYLRKVDLYVQLLEVTRVPLHRGRFSKDT